MAGEAPAPDKADLRTALGGFVGNAGILTVGAGAERSGLVCTSVISPTGDPPRYLACVSNSASALQLIRQYGCFAINALSVGHKTLAERFAGFGGIKGEARYEGANWTTLVTGAPILTDAAASLDCEVEKLIEEDGYTIVIGLVRAVASHAGRPGLVWWQGGFKAIG